MESAAIAYMLYAVWSGILSFAAASAVRAHPEDLSTLEVKLWREDTLLATGATVFALAARLVGIAFLLYAGWTHSWGFAGALFAASLVLIVIVPRLVRRLLGSAVPALVAFAVVPLAGLWMWVSVLRA
jgi:uncharacterized membrane protein